MAVSLRQLRCLVAVAETLHFRRAAERLGLSQPALSAQVAQFEDTLGVLLVERTRRRVLLTPVGREVADRARAILRDVADLEQAAQAGSRPLAGTLRVGVLRTLGPYLLPHILPVLRSRYPELRLYLREEPQDRLLAELAHGDLDLLLVAAAPRDDDHLTVRTLFREPLYAVLPLGHRLAEKQSLMPSDLAGERLIMLEEGDGMREPALVLCRQAGAAEHPDFRATSLDSLRQMVATGLGATLLPALYVKAEAEADDQIAVRPFQPPPPGRPIDMVWRRTTSRVEEYRLLERMIEDNLPDVVERAAG
ncbi:LysR substrate-binding domain-containing protein [Magnetospirillum sp. UT-4]|uniref:LysR substrate-binding domain-containing protein n=1 Tax=Magnetospirillum sp. UT-4 TaxID=2681467 RepID=UPI001383DBE9|nr:LysR substrate-binding domain-containing protein [Magnetospirillum sp. UT-4]CAA7616864.1 Hydrogen peroxide-inducible genes activator [Magnetospirillum sp. UT-4]